MHTVTTSSTQQGGAGIDGISGENTPTVSSPTKKSTIRKRVTKAELAKREARMAAYARRDAEKAAALAAMPEGVVKLKVLRPAHNQRLVHCEKEDGTPVLLQVRNNATWSRPLEVEAQRADFREDLYAVVGERAGRDPRTKGRWKRGAGLTTRLSIKA